MGCVAATSRHPRLILLLIHMLALCSSPYEYEHTNHQYARCIRYGPLAVARCVHALRTATILTLTIYDLWNMTMPCSQVLRCVGHCIDLLTLTLCTAHL